jgi:hypothetical protein
MSAPAHVEDPITCLLGPIPTTTSAHSDDARMDPSDGEGNRQHTNGYIHSKSNTPFIGLVDASLCLSPGYRPEAKLPIIIATNTHTEPIRTMTPPTHAVASSTQNNPSKISLESSGSCCCPAG